MQKQTRRLVRNLRMVNPSGQFIRSGLNRERAREKNAVCLEAGLTERDVTRLYSDDASTLPRVCLLRFVFIISCGT